MEKDKNDTRSQQGETMDWEDQEVEVVNYWIWKKKIVKNGMRKMENVNLLKREWCIIRGICKNHEGYTRKRTSYYKFHW